MLALLLFALASDVLDVDANQGPYFEIRDAVTAASDGDLIRVAPGVYGNFGVFAKTLTVARSDAPGMVRVVGAVRVQSLAADDRVVISGLDLHRKLGPDPHEALILADNAGAVRIQDCSIDGRNYAGVRIFGCDDVTFHRTQVDGQLGIEANGSNFTIWDTTCSAHAIGADGYGGLPGILATHCNVFLHGSSVRGGAGGPSDWNFAGQYCLEAGPGGNGVHTVAGSLTILDSVLTGGPGGDPTDCGAAASPGLPYFSNGGTVSLLNGEGLTLDCAAVATEGSSYPLNSSGRSGDLVLLVAGPSTARTSLPGFTGDLHIGGGLGAVRRALLGVAPVQAQLQLPLLPDFATAEIFLQAIHLRSGGAVFGPTRSLTILDSAW